MLAASKDEELCITQPTDLHFEIQFQWKVCVHFVSEPPVVRRGEQSVHQQNEIRYSSHVALVCKMRCDRICMD